MLNEELLHIIWEGRLFCRKQLKTAHGKNLVIIEPGSSNMNSGPDFLNARIKIGSLEWAGNVELHTRSSDWNKHGHHTDQAYDNVILHVVTELDLEVCNSCGRNIDTLVLCIPMPLMALMDAMQIAENWLTCHRHIHTIPPPVFDFWLRQLNKERLEQKSGFILQTLLRKDAGREDALIQAMASGFGLPLNNLPFEMLLARIPCSILFELRNDIDELEAILFGRSGFLNPPSNSGSYPKKLENIFRNILPPLQGSPVPLHLWKFLRLRPASFPTIRLSQFANLLRLRLPFTASLLSFTSIREIEQLLKVSASAYWDTHYVFGKCSRAMVKYTGYQSIHSLIINAIVPYLNATGKLDQQTTSINKANDILHELEAESNKILKNWSTFGIVPKNAFESQALIHLHNRYCREKRCIECQLGIHISTRI